MGPFAGVGRSGLGRSSPAQVTGIHTEGLGRVHEPIQAYCYGARNLPPPADLVVQKNMRLPGAGFSAAQAVQVTTDRSEVFE